MKIPNSIIIEGYKWTIKRKWKLEIDGNSCLGLCSPESRTIFLVHGLEKDEAFEVFMHEYLHAILYEKGFYLTARTLDAEELLVNGLAKELLRTFRLKFKDAAQ